MSKRRKERTLHDHTIDFGGDYLPSQEKFFRGGVAQLQ
jgi:hypothetical protein